jgi:nucleoside-diphosphate-sugar epimerase
MLHYEDAAAAAVAALTVAGKSNSQDREIYLACDDSPVTRKEICEAALISGLFPDAAIPVFASESGLYLFIMFYALWGIIMIYFNILGPKGKTVDCSWSRKTLDWKPK